MPPIEGVSSNPVTIDFSQVYGLTADGNLDTSVLDHYFTGFFTPSDSSASSSGGAGVTAWLNANAKTVLIGAGVLVGVLFVIGGRRR